MRQRFFLLSICLLVSGCSGAESDKEQMPANPEASNPSLQFRIADEEIRRVDLETMKAALPTHRLDFFDHMYGKRKRYLAFALQDVLQMAYAEKWKPASFTDVAFQALDGYEAVAEVAKTVEEGGYLCFADLEVTDWEPISRKQASPGPFYLVWTGARQTPEHAYPWPWQLASISIVNFAEEYPQVYPRGLSVDSPVYAGFQLFKQRCVRCHAMNRDGGKIGPDLNAPQSILAYRSEQMVRELIKRPSDYRYTHMPDHRDLSEADLDHLIEYFRHKRNEVNGIGRE